MEFIVNQLPLNVTTTSECLVYPVSFHGENKQTNKTNQNKTKQNHISTQSRLKEHGLELGWEFIMLNPKILETER